MLSCFLDLVLWCVVTGYIVIALFLARGGVFVVYTGKDIASYIVAVIDT